jgi:ATP-dependent exoDNAse (exonuclease V) beta subunit
MNLPTLPDFSHILKDEATHTYTTADGQVLRNATALVESLQIPFNADYHAGRKALDRGISKEAVLAEWEQIRTTAQARGTRFHAHIQARLAGEEVATEEGAGTDMLETSLFDHWWEDARVGPARLEPLQTEWVMGDSTLGIAGTADALFINGQGRLVLVDWKTGKRFNTYNRFQSLLAPFSDVPDCELYRYSMQLSLYRLILRRAGLPPISESYIFHFSGHGYQRYSALDFTDRLEAWLTHQPTLIAS